MDDKEVKSDFEVCEAATACLTATPDSLPRVYLPKAADQIERIRSKIMSVSMDSTPNWGIKGVRVAAEEKPQNWYFRDGIAKQVAMERYRNLDQQKLAQIVSAAVQDIAGKDAKTVGYGLYGSYFYRRNALLPEDLDILALIDGRQCFSVDALRYPSTELRDAFISKSKFSPISNDVGISMVSVDELRPTNKSYLVTDIALLDVSTTLSHQASVDAEPLPPFVIIHNAQKLLRWGISSILSKPFSLLSRIDEAIRMRKMVMEDYAQISFDRFALEDSLPPKEEILLGMNDTYLVEITRTLMNILMRDELKIREWTADHLRPSSNEATQ